MGRAYSAKKEGGRPEFKKPDDRNKGTGFHAYLSVEHTLGKDERATIRGESNEREEIREESDGLPYKKHTPTHSFITPQKKPYSRMFLTLLENTTHKPIYKPS